LYQLHKTYEDTCNGCSTVAAAAKVQNLLHALIESSSLLYSNLVQVNFVRI
jgi:hypothetical protein